MKLQTIPRLLLRLLAVACVAAAGLVVVAPAPSGAEAPQEVGWWSRQLPFQGEPAAAEGSAGNDATTGDIVGQGAGDAVRFTPAQVGPVTTVPLPVPPPTVPEPPITTPDSGQGNPNPFVPEGGLWVGNDSTGANAISALRFRGNIGSGELFLTVADGTTTVGPLVACPALSDWTAGPAGAWRDRPAHDCDRFQLSGRVSPDGTQVSFTIPNGFVEFGTRTLDVIILPHPSSGDVFSVYFEAPDADSFTILSGQSPPPPDTTLPEPEPLSLPTTMPPATQAPSFSTPAPPSQSPTTTEAAAPPVALDGSGGTPVPEPVAEVFEPLTESRASRVLAVLLLLGIGLGLWYLSGQQVRAPQLLGGLAGGGTAPAPTPQPVETGRGIGRFQRPRQGPPTRL